MRGTSFILHSPSIPVGHTPSVVIIDAQGNLRSDTILAASSLGLFVKAAMK